MSKFENIAHMNVQIFCACIFSRRKEYFFVTQTKILEFQK